MENKYQLPEGSLISYFSNKVKLYGGINFAQGIPGFNPPSELMNILSEIATNKNIHQYAPGIGNYELIERLCEYYSDFNINQNNITILQGATEAITLTYLYLRQQLGHLNVLGFDPVYESYNNLPNIFGDLFIAFDMNNLDIDFDQLEKTITQHKVNLVFVNSPGNPLGKVFSKKEIETILELANKHHFYIIVDAVYRELYFNEKPYIPIDIKNEWLFYVNSFSKLYSITGWRVGYLICHERHMKRIRSIHDYTGLCVSNPMQQAILEYIKRYGILNNYVSNLRNKLIISFNKLSQALTEFGFEIPDIQGGYFIWAKLPPKFEDGFIFAVDLYENEKVAIIPGIHFSKKGKNYVRLNAARELNEIEEGIERIRRFVLH